MSNGDPSRTWRPFGYWALTLHVAATPFLIVIGPELFPNFDSINIEILSDLYPATLAAWISAAAVRQWGKNKGTET